MKLDYKKTIKVGFAFAIITIFWSAYDFVIPLLLERAFGLSNALRGLIMGLDNLLSLFLLPIFGKISDKSKSKFGRRTPFIVIGTIATVVLMVFVPVSSNKQLREANTLKAELVENLTENEWAEIYQDYGDEIYLKNNRIDEEKFIAIAMEGQTTLTKKGVFKKTYHLDGVELSQDEYEPILQQNENYQKFCSSPLNSWLSKQINVNITQKNISRLVVYMIILFFVLLAMTTFRSPAVALMPDVTPKPLRSPANAIINLMGGLGTALAFIIYTVGFVISETSYIGIFACVAGGMLLLMVCFLLLVNENKFVKECEEICAEYGIDANEGTISEHDSKKLKNLDPEHKAKMVSFFLILASIFMWFMGYNAVSSALSVYTTKALNLSPSVASLISGVSMAVSAIAFIPVGYLASKIGRRKSIMLGFIMAIISFVLIWLWIKPGSLAPYLFASFYLIAGFGLIIANVNTFPMVVELSRAEDVGKYTGYYYVATMSAQAITPFISGLFMDNFGDSTLFSYSAACVAVATILMFFVKHGDSKLITKKSKLEMLADADGAD